MNPYFEFISASSDSGQKTLNDKVSKMKQLRQPLMEKLPTLKYNDIELPDGRRANRGDILKRPISQQFPLQDVDHCCFVYGESEDGESIIIEMGPENNVAPNTFEKFLKHHSVDDIEIIPKPKGTRITSILKRAKEWQFETYDFYSKNCQQFAYYCVFGKRTSPGINRLDKFSLPFIKLSIANLKYSIATNQDDLEYLEFLTDYLTRLTTLRDRLTANIQQYSNSGFLS